MYLIVGDILSCIGCPSYCEDMASMPGPRQWCTYFLFGKYHVSLCKQNKHGETRPTVCTCCSLICTDTTGLVNVILCSCNRIRSMPPESSSSDVTSPTDDDWHGIDDKIERRRRQNRVNQRAWRKYIQPRSWFNTAAELCVYRCRAQT